MTGWSNQIVIGVMRLFIHQQQVRVPVDNNTFFHAISTGNWLTMLLIKFPVQNHMSQSAANDPAESD